MNMAGHDTDLAFAGVMMPGQFGPIRRVLDFCSFDLTFTMSSTGMPSVMQIASSISASIGLKDRRCRKRRRNINHGRIRAGFRFRIRHGIEHRKPQSAGVPPLPGVTPPTICRAALQAPAPQWKVPLRAGKALHQITLVFLYRREQLILKILFLLDFFQPLCWLFWLRPRLSPPHRPAPAPRSVSRPEGFSQIFLPTSDRHSCPLKAHHHRHRDV
jgi:hypothetical protein